MGFSVRGCWKDAWLGGFFADALLMDRHRTPAMTRESICLEVYAHGVCAVGCNRQRWGL